MVKVAFDNDTCHVEAIFRERAPHLKQSIVDFLKSEDLEPETVITVTIPGLMLRLTYERFLKGVLC